MINYILSSPALQKMKAKLVPKPSPSVSGRKDYDMEYIANLAKYMMSVLINTSQYSAKSAGEIIRARNYAQGKHSTDMVRRLIDVRTGPADASGRRSGPSVTNIDWSPVKVLPRYRQLAVEGLLKYNWEPIVRAMDTASDYARRLEESKDKIILDSRMQALMSDTGVQISPTVAAKREDVEWIAAMGGYSTPVELVYEDALKSLTESRDFETLRRQIAGDIVDLNKAGIMVEWDAITDQPKFKYVDVAGLFMPPSDYDDYRDAEWAAVVSYQTIGDIRSTGGVDIAQIGRLSKMFKQDAFNSGISARIDSTAFRSNWHNDGTQLGVFDAFRVPVVSFFWKETDAETFVSRRRRDGAFSFEPVRDGATLSPKDQAAGAEISTYYTEYIYECKWIPGADITLSCQRSNMTMRQGKDGKRKAILPIIIWSNIGDSIIESCIPHIDAIERADKKMQSVLNNLPPGPRFGIDIGALVPSVRLGDTEYDVSDLMELFSGRGVFIYSTRPEIALNPAINARSPISEIPTNVYNDVQMYMSTIVSNIDSIRRVTGINEYVDGTGDARRVQNAMAGMMTESANLSIGAPISGFASIFYNTMVATVALMNTKLDDGTISWKTYSVDSNVARVISIMPEQALRDYTIVCRPGASASDREELRQLVTNASAQGKINANDLMLILTMIQRGQVKLAMLYYQRAEESSMQEAHARQIELQQAQAQAQAQAAVTAETERRKTIELKGQFDIAVAKINAGAITDTSAMKQQVDTAKLIQEAATQNNLSAPAE